MKFVLKVNDRRRYYYQAFPDLYWPITLEGGAVEQKSLAGILAA